MAWIGVACWIYLAAAVDNVWPLVVGPELPRPQWVLVVLLGVAVTTPSRRRWLVVPPLALLVDALASPSPGGLMLGCQFGAYLLGLCEPLLAARSLLGKVLPTAIGLLAASLIEAAWALSWGEWQLEGPGNVRGLALTSLATLLVGLPIVVTWSAVRPGETPP